MFFGKEYHRFLFDLFSHEEQHRQIDGGQCGDGKVRKTPNGVGCYGGAHGDAKAERQKIEDDVSFFGRALILIILFEIFLNSSKVKRGL